MVVDGSRGESRSQAVARRLREELAGRRISVAEVARRLGATQQKLSRRMTGQTPWGVNELDEVCEASGVSSVYVATGIKSLPNGDDDGTAGAPTRARTWDLRIKRPQDGAEDPQVRFCPECGAALP
ncbi:XRE family transcriptional regulator [Mycobacteroides chelonae]|uniref:XRE family transcriptional regulator n=1 Tax=Mycobacteroides chelonae TaxID=1774 RepID=A0AB73TY84_MYCCH|nr:helix-turn-helix domain-containing protein [Mycobacteroides chelonae]QDF69399.1 XRE family transcriptional regulator [Mycobacteroides chelonae]